MLLLKETNIYDGKPKEINDILMQELGFACVTIFRPASHSLSILLISFRMIGVRI